MKILFAGGGTGGHLYSGIAIAREALRLAPGTEILFVGTERGIEARVLPREGFRLLTMKVTGIKGRGLFGALAGAWKIPAALLSSFSLLRRERPGAVVGIGGYASGPTVMAAAAAGYPTSIVEQNVIPGFTNRLLARVVRRIYAPMEEAVAHFPARHKVKVTGNPIRRQVVDEALAAAGNGTGNGSSFRLLVFGGSLGANRINRALVEALPRLKDLGVQVVHQTGEKEHASVAEAYKRVGFEADVRPFLHDMGAQYARAHLVVCRAGASTVSELLAIGKPAVLVPYPHAIYDHQTLNAKALENRGAARWVPDAELTGERVVREVSDLVKNPEGRATLAANARALGKPDAATEIAREILSLSDQSLSVKSPPFPCLLLLLLLSLTLSLPGNYKGQETEEETTSLSPDASFASEARASAGGEPASRREGVGVERISGPRAAHEVPSVCPGAAWRVLCGATLPSPLPPPDGRGETILTITGHLLANVPDAGIGVRNPSDPAGGASRGGAA